MKRIITTILKISTFVLGLALYACTMQMEEEAYEGLTIKSFIPTSVMTGTEMSITGNQLDKVVAIVFPDDIEVRTFELVSSNMIKVNVPDGIIPESGRLKLVTSDGAVESKASMRLAKPTVKSLDPGDEIKPGKVLTIKGEDMEFTTKVSFPSSKEGETVDILSMDFLRKSPDNVKVTVPEGVMNGTARLTLTIADGKTLMTPEINIVSGPSEEDNYIICTIESVAAGRLLTRNDDAGTPIIQDATGSKNQEFSFIPVPDEWGTYYLKNNGTGEYLSIGAEYEWRMGWYVDPSEAPKPENAKFQVFPIAGTDGYYRIHVLGSIDLGLDSTDDWSEVYSNKSDASNPMYQWIINKISGPDFADPNDTPPVEETSNILFEGAQEPNPDDNGWVSLKIEANQLTNLTVGNILRMHFTPTEGQWLQLDYRDGNDGAIAGYEWAGMDGFETYADGYIDLEVTQELYDRISVTGISFRGFWFTITKVELIGGGSATPPGEDDGDVNYIWTGSVAMSWNGMGDLTWGGYDWSTVTAGSVLTAHVELDTTQNYWQIVFAKGDGWVTLPSGAIMAGDEGGVITMAAGTTTVGLTLTEEDLDELVNGGGLLMNGTNYTLTGLSLK